MMFRRVAQRAVAPRLAAAASFAAHSARFCATADAAAATTEAPATDAAAAGRKRSFMPFKYYPGGTPGFDIRRLAEDQKGHFVRVMYVQECVLFVYVPQNAADSEQKNEKRIQLMLPTTFIARFLSVIEGRTDKCEIATRGTQGSFSKTDGGTFTIKCSTFTGSGNFDWDCTFTAGESVLLHRFMTQALHFNLGFK